MRSTLLEIYRHALDAGGPRIGEDTLPFHRMPELEWQARWFNGEFGCKWTSVDGSLIHIEDFGRWNREAGPDFVDARIRIGAREIRGAIELDIDARDWERHGHATNPSFRDVALHVFIERPVRRFYTRTSDHREVIQLHLPPAGRRIDEPIPIKTELPGDPQRIRSILLAAARHRLDLKARALRRTARVHGENESWFAAFAVALGYKRNSTPFLLLAQRVGLRLAAESRGEALLFGTAGFLETPTPPRADRTVRTYLRTLWENWWTMRAEYERWILPPNAWHYGGIRPANHPQRRVATLARIAAAWPTICQAVASGHRDALVDLLASLEHSFWMSRFNLQSAPLQVPQALLGAERIRDILINIYHPLAIERDATAWENFLAEKGSTPPSVVRHAARRFFGAAAEAKDILRPAFAQQGLLQLDQDYRTATAPAEFLNALYRMPAPLDVRQSLV